MQIIFLCITLVLNSCDPPSYSYSGKVTGVEDSCGRLSYGAKGTLEAGCCNPNRVFLIGRVISHRYFYDTCSIAFAGERVKQIYIVESQSFGAARAAVPARIPSSLN